MKPTKKTVLNKEQLRVVAKQFNLVLGGTMEKPKFRSKNSKIWVEFDHIRGQYKSKNWRKWMRGGIADVVASATKGGKYPHPDVVKSIGAKIERLL
jgi:hypothetical protein